MFVSTRDHPTTRRAAALAGYRRVAALLFVVLYLSDGVLTLIGHAHHQTESSPGVRLWLSVSPLLWFVLVKLLLTPVALVAFVASLRVWPRRTGVVSLLVLVALAWVVVHNLAYLG